MPPVSGTPSTANPGVVMPSQEAYVDADPDDVGTRANFEEAAPQQGAPEPGSGTVVAEKEKVPFKDQVFGYSKTIRGTVFRQPETKEEGEKILHGEITPRQSLEHKEEKKEEKKKEEKKAARQQSL